MRLGIVPGAPAGAYQDSEGGLRGVEEHKGCVVLERKCAGAAHTAAHATLIHISLDHKWSMHNDEFVTAQGVSMSLHILYTFKGIDMLRMKELAQLR